MNLDHESQQLGVPLPYKGTKSQWLVATESIQSPNSWYFTSNLLYWPSNISNCITILGIKSQLLVAVGYSILLTKVVPQLPTLGTWLPNVARSDVLYSQHLTTWDYFHISVQIKRPFNWSDDKFWHTSFNFWSICFKCSGFFSLNVMAEPNFRLYMILILYAFFPVLRNSSW